MQLIFFLFVQCIINIYSYLYKIFIPKMHKYLEKYFISKGWLGNKVFYGIMWYLYPGFTC